MESYRVQQAANMGITPIMTGSNQQQALVNGDFFAAFLQLITQGNGEQTDELALLNGEVENSLNTKGEKDEEVNLNLMELIAEMLNGSASYNQPLNDKIKAAIESFSASKGEITTLNEQQINANFINELVLSQTKSNGDAFAKTLQEGINNQGTNQAANPVLQNIIERLDKLGPQTTKPQNSTMPVDENAILNTVAKASNGQATSEEALFNGEMGFKNSISQVQKLMKSQQKGDEDIPKTEFQQAVSPKIETILQDKAPVIPKTVDLEDLSSQIKNNLSSGAIFDKKEFSVKLKPEGLGEVTIKLISEQNRITMSIVTATTEAAKALNDKLPTLRETMRDMQVEVRDVVSSTSQENNGNLQQSLQQQANQHNQFTDSRNSSSTQSYNSLEQVDIPEVSNPVQRLNERMNMYI